MTASRGIRYKVKWNAEPGRTHGFTGSHGSPGDVPGRVLCSSLITEHGIASRIGRPCKRTAVWISLRTTQLQ